MARIDNSAGHSGQYQRNRKKIFKTQNTCGICGRPVDMTLEYPHPMSKTVDHIVPIAHGGHPSDIENLQLAHWTCNRQKSDKFVSVQHDVKKIEVVSNRVLPLHFDWKRYVYD